MKYLTFAMLYIVLMYLVVLNKPPDRQIEPWSIMKSPQTGKCYEVYTQYSILWYTYQTPLSEIPCR